MGSAETNRAPFNLLEAELVSQGLALDFSCDFRSLELTFDHEAHAPVIAARSVDPLGGQCKGTSIGVPGQPVVALGVFGHRYTSDIHQATHIRRVLQAPRVVRK